MPLLPNHFLSCFFVGEGVGLPKSDILYQVGCPESDIIRYGQVGSRVSTVVRDLQKQLTGCRYMPMDELQSNTFLISITSNYFCPLKNCKYLIFKAKFLLKKHIESVCFCFCFLSSLRYPHESYRSWCPSHQGLNNCLGIR